MKEVSRWRKAAKWSVLILMVSLLLPLVPYGLAAIADTGAPPKVENPGSDLWRAVRERGVVLDASTQIRGVDSNAFMNVGGEEWRQYRMQSLIPTSAWVIGGVLLAIVAFYLIRGRIPIAAGRSGDKIPRFTLNQRTIHWFVASTFVMLGLTGMILLYGRFVLIPLLGPDGFGATAFVAKRIHDFVGPAFGIGLVFMLIFFIKGNFPSLKTDLKWTLKGGGMFGGHVSAGRYNAGEKLWFWLVVMGGAAVVFSGLVLDFPAIAALVGDTRDTKEWYHVIHSVAAVVLTAASFGHIYMGTLAMEGTLEIMTHGYADTNWAKEHHDLWYEEMKERGEEVVQGSATDADGQEARQT